MTTVVLLLFEILVMVDAIRVSGTSDVTSHHNIPVSFLCNQKFKWFNFYP